MMMMIMNDEDMLAHLCHLLADTYLQDALTVPNIGVVLRTITDLEPMKNFNGMISLVGMFVELTNNFLRFERLTDATVDYESRSMSSVFGRGECHASCPLTALISFVIRRNLLIMPEEMKALMDYMHGVILFNKVSKERINVIDGLLVAIDNYYFHDVDDEAAIHALRQVRKTCSNCVAVDRFLKVLYNAISDPIVANTRNGHVLAPSPLAWRDVVTLADIDM